MLVSENLKDILKPKSKKEIEKDIETLSPMNLLNTSVENNYLKGIKKFFKENPNTKIRVVSELMSAILNSDIEIIEEMLRNLDKFPDIPTYSELSYYVDQSPNKEKVIKLLEKYGIKRFKRINEDRVILEQRIEDILRPKSKEEIETALEGTAKGKLLQIALDKRIPSMIQKALDRGAKINDRSILFRVSHILNKPEKELVQYMAPGLKLRLGFESKEATANQIFSAGIYKNNNELLKKAIKKGATNTDISGNEAYIIAVEKEDLELLRLLLKDPKTNAAMGGKQGEYYGYDNAPIKIAAKKGLTKFVKLLLQTRPVDPTVDNNFPFRHALKNKHWAVVELLLNDNRVYCSLENSGQLKKAINKLILMLKEE